MNSGADLDANRVYRWKLWRIWDTELERVTWIMLNPSTADESKDDATIRRCVGFTKRWGYGGIVVVNLFAFRATKPSDLVLAPDPIGQENDDYISHACEGRTALVIAAWGAQSHPLIRKRATEVIKSFNGFGKLHCLGKTADGSPRHPVRLAYSTELQEIIP